MNKKHNAKWLDFNESKGVLIDRGNLRRTFRDLTEGEKDRYKPGDTVAGRLHRNKEYLKKEYELKILSVKESEIIAFMTEDFVYSDAYSKSHLKEVLGKHYGKRYTDESVVSLIEFEVISAHYSK